MQNLFKGIWHPIGDYPDWLSKSNAVKTDGVYVAKGYFYDPAGCNHHARKSDLVGKFIPKFDVAYFPFEGNEIALNSFSVLIDCDAKWMEFDWTLDIIPMHAVIAGQDMYKDEMYIGRIFMDQHLAGGHEPNWAIGTVLKNNFALYVPWHGKEIEIRYPFEILIWDV